ncbi:MAG: hypothetical protein AAF609_08490 [Cyanobacteria bacterium P01_C01_bin.120]
MNPKPGSDRAFPWEIITERGEIQRVQDDFALSQGLPRADLSQIAYPIETRFVGDRTYHVHITSNSHNRTVQRRSSPIRVWVICAALAIGFNIGAVWAVVTLWQPSATNVSPR